MKLNSILNEYLYCFTQRTSVVLFTWQIGWVLVTRLFQINIYVMDWILQWICLFSVLEWFVWYDNRMKSVYPVQRLMRDNAIIRWLFSEWFLRFYDLCVFWCDLCWWFFVCVCLVVQIGTLIYYFEVRHFFPHVYAVSIAFFYFFLRYHGDW